MHSLMWIVDSYRVMVLCLAIGNIIAGCMLLFVPNFLVNLNTLLKKTIAKSKTIGKLDAEYAIDENIIKKGKVIGCVSAAVAAMLFFIFLHI